MEGFRLKRGVVVLMSMLTLLSLPHFAATAVAQNVSSASKTVKVSGSLVDAEGISVIGATIIENERPTNGAVSNIDGGFTITVTVGSTITVSSLTHQSQEYVVKNDEHIFLTMLDDTKALDEVVVVGYGTMKRSDITGSIASVRAEDLLNTHSTSLADALQGKASGLEVTTVSAAPGGSSSIRIRGTNSLLSEAEPLYVVDGFAVDDISSLNTNDILSVEILKDASSTAIYGSRGSNGVILIETRKGASGAPTVSFTSMVGIQQVYRSIDLLNGEQFANVFNEYCINSGEPIYFDGSTRSRPLPETIGEGTDWYDQIMQLGMVQRYDVSVVGGTNASSYRVSGGYYGNKGVIVGGDFNRISLSASNKIELRKWLDLQMNISLSRSDTNGSGDRTGLESSNGTLNNAMKMSPTINVYDEYGNYNRNSLPGSQSEENPVAYANEVLDRTVKDNIATFVNFGIRPIEGLLLQIKAGVTMNHSDSYGYLSTKTIEGAKVGGKATVGSQIRQNLTNEYIANYNKEFGKHSLVATAAFSLERFDTEFNSISATGLTVDDLSYAGLSSAESVQQPVYNKYQTSLMSGLARLNYSYDNRYLFTVTTRLDGNSSFAQGNKWGQFPSAAFAWRISEESFLKDVREVNDLKFRLSYGVTGNSKIGYNRATGLLVNERYPFGDSVLSGLSASTIGNSDLTWEKTQMYNTGVDLSMFKSRLTFTADVYYKHTSDMLMSYDIPTTSGFKVGYVNAGVLENKGMEFAVSGKIIAEKSVQWDLGANISFNRDKVLELYEGNSLAVDLGDNQTLWINEGQPIRQFTGKKILGIFASDEEVAQYVNAEGKQIQPGMSAGDIKYADLDGDGSISAADNIVYGSANPDFTYGINSKVRYKNFTFDLLINGSQGNWIYNRGLAYTRNTTNIRNNLTAELLDRWTPDNTDAKYPRLGSEDNLPAYEDASYLRIQNVSLSYAVPRKYLNGINRLVVSAGIDNLYVITGYSGWDPDVNSAYGGSGNVNIGTDVNSYPKPRTYRFTASLTF